MGAVELLTTPRHSSATASHTGSYNSNTGNHCRYKTQPPLNFQTWQSNLSQYLQRHILSEGIVLRNTQGTPIPHLHMQGNIVVSTLIQAEKHQEISVFILEENHPNLQLVLKLLEGFVNHLGRP